MSFKEMTIDRYVKELASSAPVPGGGGSSGLIAGVAAALANMVGSLTLGKKKYAAVEAEVLEIKEELNRLQEELLDCMDADAEVFMPLTTAYSLPKNTEAEQKYKEKVLEDALTLAVSVPLKVLEKACATMRLTARIGEIGSVLAISDAACAACTLKAAMQAAAVNVYINTGMMKDSVRAADFNQQVSDLLDEHSPLADKVYENIVKRVKKEL